MTGFQIEDKGALYALKKMQDGCIECVSLFMTLCREAHIPAQIMSGLICHRNCVVTATDFHN
ncbi:MAG: transglutaminase domain-containing protein [bacterium]